MDIRLHYTECGEGEPLVLLHGNGEDSGYFKHQTAYFSAEYRVIAVDTRGHGQSPRGDRPFTLKQFARDLKCFLDELGLRRVNLLGFSDGGNIALIFACVYPSYVKRLIVNGANLYPSGVKFRWQWESVSEYIRQNLKKEPEMPEAGEASKLELMQIMVKEPHLTSGDLKRLSMPVLVIAGTDDMIRESHTKKIAAAIPGAELALVEGNHFIAAKNPEVFNRVVERFLKEN